MLHSAVEFVLICILLMSTEANLENRMASSMAKENAD